MTSKYARERLSWNGWGWVDERFELGGREEALLSFLRQALGMKTLRETPRAFASGQTSSFKKRWKPA